MSASNLQGFSNLIAGNSKVEPKNPKWLNKTDTIHSTQHSLPTVDLAQEDLASQTAAVTAASKRIVDRARGKNKLIKKKKVLRKSLNKVIKKRATKSKKIVKKTLKRLNGNKARRR